MNQARYQWVDERFVRWIKNESIKMREQHGLYMGSQQITRMLYDRIIAPNNITIKDIIKPKVTISVKKWKKLI